MRAHARLAKRTYRELIVSADDFGLSLEVNEAIEGAHRDGILRAASLMVGAPRAADAVERAQRLPGLRVGLHLVLVNGRPLLPPEHLPDLVDADGYFPTDLAKAGVRYFFRRGAREQLEAEIRAQFDAFARTGLALDHVNAQNHMHVHPTILGLILKVGSQYGMRAVRVPREPFFASWAAARDDFGGRLANAVFLWPWLTLMKMRLRGAGLRTNDFVFGMNDSGRMTLSRVLALMRRLPRGISEMYFHPATKSWPGIERAIENYAFAEELAALTSSEVADALRGAGITPIAFSDVVEERAA